MRILRMRLTKQKEQLQIVIADHTLAIEGVPDFIKIIALKLDRANLAVDSNVPFKEITRILNLLNEHGIPRTQVSTYIEPGSPSQFDKRMARSSTIIASPENWLDVQVGVFNREKVRIFDTKNKKIYTNEKFLDYLSILEIRSEGIHISVHPSEQRCLDGFIKLLAKNEIFESTILVTEH